MRNDTHRSFGRFHANLHKTLEERGTIKVERAGYAFCVEWPAAQFQLQASRNSSGLELVSVSGQVKSGAQQIKTGEIIFWTADGRGYISPIKDGKFTSPVWEAGTGLPKGNYSVTIRAAGPVSQKYALRNSSGLQVEVKDGMNEFDFDLK